MGHGILNNNGLRQDKTGTAAKVRQGEKRMLYIAGRSGLSLHEG